MGSVLVNGVAERSTSIAPERSGAARPRDPSSDHPVTREVESTVPADDADVDAPDPHPPSHRIRYRAAKRPSSGGPRITTPRDAVRRFAEGEVLEALARPGLPAGLQCG